MSDELHDLVGPYALGALDDSDATIFEVHLETCEACQSELFSMSDVVMELQSTVEASSPADETNAVVHTLPKRPALRWYAAAAAAVAIIAGVWISGVFETSRVEEIAGAADVETISLAGDPGVVEVVLSNEAAGVALDDADFDELAEPQLYVLWVIREGDEEPEFVGNITEFTSVDQWWCLRVEDVAVLAISIEDAPSPQTPSDQVVYVGQRDAS